ncbi:hypothetical protein AOE01nite_03280 [Acetobacter oeni]|uniref:RNB domain-containing protein n=2 Tax=Acetobacter oeni TaxID=304077 RepID=A0A511XGM2_9PROT|nr:hypothetical protein AOE01nite_03280 [Acetobacter oeni]
MARELPGRPALVVGTRVLARLKPLGSGRFEGRTLRVFNAPALKLTGMLKSSPSGYFIEPLNFRPGTAWSVSPDDISGARAGDFVVAVPVSKTAAFVTRRLGRNDMPDTVSLLSITTHDLPEAFPGDVRVEAAACETIDGSEAVSAGREDLRHIPFLTVDGPDARDFDDAIWAERITGGFRLRVAIADVAHYVRPGSALDREARDRGLSVYFADRVIPMLPERLSDDLCSLRPGADRLCVMFETVIDATGHPQSFRIRRGVMKSRARLTYAQLQQIHEGHKAAPDDLPPDLIKTLYAAHAALSAARESRDILLVERNEFRTTIASDGKTLISGAMPVYESHRLIENFMVQANFAAAREMKARSLSGLFRIHPTPAGPEQVRLAFRAGTSDRAGQKKPLLPNALYSAAPSGHFALDLEVYAHVTSPIRRYADLVCHRVLMGETGIGSPDEASRYDCLARHLDAREARAASASREAQDRLLACYLSRQTHLIFAGHVSGETPSGTLVTLTEPGLTGLLVSDVAVCKNMTFDSNRTNKEFHDGGRISQASPGLVFPKKGTAVYVRPVALDVATFRCVFVLADRQP